MRLPRGLFTDICGIDCRIEFRMKNEFITFLSYWNSVRGRNVKKLYFVELILLVGGSGMPSGSGLLPL